MKLKTLLFCSASLVWAYPAIGQDSRELDAHEHGHGALNIAIEGDQIALELEVPGFDIVGFEYSAESDEDKAAISAALETLGDPLNLFGIPDAAGCVASQAMAELHAEDEHHEEHDEHDDHAEGEEDHDAHGDEDHEEHAEHGDDDHEEHAEHDEEGHEEHGEEESHTEFHAEYLLTCSEIDSATTIELLYFDAFDNAEELEVQLVTDKGAALLEATRDEPILDLTKAM